MIDNKFSSQAFEKAGFGTSKARSLCKKLENEIQRELDIVVEKAMLEVVSKLNSLGHNLKVFEFSLGNKHFREASGSSGQGYKFLVASDVVITVGYPETVDMKDLRWLESS